MAKEQSLKIDMLKSFILIITIALLFTKSSYALSNEKWEDYNIFSKESNDSILGIVGDGGDIKLIMLMVKVDNGCVVEGKVEEGGFWLINNKKVGMRQQCQNGFMGYMVASESEMEYLIKELKSKKEVVFRKDNADKNITFSTKGFIESFNNFKGFKNRYEISSEKWEGISIASQEHKDAYFLEIYEFYGGNKSVALLFRDKKCLNFEKDLKGGEPWYINGRKVNILRQCVDEGSRAYIMEEDEDREYLINELKTKDKVIFKRDNITSTFSTKGFEAAFNNFKITYDTL